MVWLFALGIIALAVFHKGFRKVLLWLSAIAGCYILAAVIFNLIH